MLNFTPQERAFLRLVQGDLPDSATPFADLAAESGLTEENALELLSRLKENGTIRRFGVNIRHQKAGFPCNAMVAWLVPPDRADHAGMLMAEHPMLSHCYYRPSPAPDWPFALYTMIHGRSPAEIGQAVADLKTKTGIHDCVVLESLRELKKTSMDYF